MGVGAQRERIPAILLHEARELRKKQDERLKSLLTFARSIPAGLLSGGAIVIAASGDLSGNFAVVVVCSAGFLALLAVAAEMLTSKWVEGPDLKDLVKTAEAPVYGSADLESSLIDAFMDSFEKNEASLKRARFCVIVEMEAALAAAITLVVSLIKVL